MLPLPSGKGIEQDAGLGASAQEKTIPPTSPEIKMFLPLVSVAVKLRVAVPTHQPFKPFWLQDNSSMVNIGGLSGFGGGSQTTSQEKQQPLQLRPSWSLPALLQEATLLTLTILISATDSAQLLLLMRLSTPQTAHTQQHAK